jgi:hypothetical protein
MIALIGVACVYPYISCDHGGVKAIKAIMLLRVTRCFFTFKATVLSLIGVSGFPVLARGGRQRVGTGGYIAERRAVI